MRLSFLNYYPTQAPESTNNDEFHIFLLSVHPQNIQLFMSDNQGGEDVTQVLCSMQCISTNSNIILWIVLLINPDLSYY